MNYYVIVGQSSCLNGFAKSIQDKLEQGYFMLPNAMSITPVGDTLHFICVMQKPSPKMTKYQKQYEKDMEVYGTEV